MGVSRLGIELHLENGEAGVGGVELPRRVHREPVLLASAGGDDSEEGGLEVVNDFEGGFLRFHALGFVVGDELFWGWELSLLCSWRWLRGGNGRWSWWFFH